MMRRRTEPMAAVLRRLFLLNRRLLGPVLDWRRELAQLWRDETAEPWTFQVWAVARQVRESLRQVQAENRRPRFHV